MGEHDAADGVDQILGLQVSELLLLVAEFDVEEVVVDLRDDCLERHAALDARGLTTGATMLRGLTKPGAGIGQGGLFKEARGMAGGGNLLDALAEGAGAAADVEDLGLVQGNFDCARSDEVGGRVDVCKRCVHSVSPPWGGC